MTHYIERYWRDATPQDAIKEPPMMARFRDDCESAWHRIDKLVFWDRSKFPWNSLSYRCYQQCQVYDAPDPGEGWRLIDVEKETPQAGDEFKYGNGWGYCNEFLRDTFYASNQVIRRRIEQPKPEPRYEPFRWEDREQLRGRWITWKHEDGTTIETQINHLSEHRLEGLWFKSRNPVWLLENATFLDTGEPVGRRVE